MTTSVRSGIGSVEPMSDDDTPLSDTAHEAGSDMRGRRNFLRAAGLGAAALALPRALEADPYAPVALNSRDLPSTTAPVRIRGVVRAGRRGLAGVAVSDGVSVVATDREGRFELLAPGWAEFVHLSLPSGMQIPRNPQGTARFYERIVRNSSGQMDVNFELERMAGSDEKHAFLLWADPQTRNQRQMDFLHAQSVPDAVQTIRDLGDRHVFGISAGDIMSDDLSLFPQYEQAVSRIGIPFFQVVGNHDLDFTAHHTEASYQTFSRYFGPGYYSFNRGSVHYVVINDVLYHGAGYIGYITRDQLTWLENDLKLVEAGSTVVVTLHIPLMTTEHHRRREGVSLGGTVANREAIYRLLEPYNAHVLSGHMHENEHLREGGVRHHVSGTVCGAWWSGPICFDGTPNGYPVFEVNGQEITHRYKSTALPFSHQLRAYGRGADPSAEDEIVANVWNWEPEWTVVLHEGSDRRGSMARRVGLDPWAVELKAGPWATNHMFYAPVSATARDIVVEATDGQGRKYTSRVGDPMPLDPAIWRSGMENL